MHFGLILGLLGMFSFMVLIMLVSCAASFFHESFEIIANACVGSACLYVSVSCVYVSVLRVYA